MVSKKNNFMKETDIQTIFGKNNKIHGCFELKLSKKNSIAFNAVKPHQVIALSKASGSGLFHKISDFPMFAGSKARFNSQKPFDCVFLKETPSFVVVCWYVPLKPKEFHYILIEDWLGEEAVSKRKSLTKERSKEICLYDKIYKNILVKKPKKEIVS